uniref:Leucine-rich repeat containing protein n=1 Tax=Rhabditophanes sp. KR3021 TaxID=114890 RepID=A0AC35TQX6_9BILA
MRYVIPIELALAQPHIRHDCNLPFGVKVKLGQTSVRNYNSMNNYFYKCNDFCGSVAHTDDYICELSLNYYSARVLFLDTVENEEGWSNFIDAIPCVFFDTITTLKIKLYYEMAIKDNFDVIQQADKVHYNAMVRMIKKFFEKAKYINTIIIYFCDEVYNAETFIEILSVFKNTEITRIIICQFNLNFLGSLINFKRTLFSNLPYLQRMDVKVFITDEISDAEYKLFFDLLLKCKVKWMNVYLCLKKLSIIECISKFTGQISRTNIKFILDDSGNLSFEDYNENEVLKMEYFRTSLSLFANYLTGYSYSFLKDLKILIIISSTLKYWSNDIKIVKSNFSYLENLKSLHVKLDYDDSFSRKKIRLITDIVCSAPTSLNSLLLDSCTIGMNYCGNKLAKACPNLKKLAIDYKHVRYGRDYLQYHELNYFMAFKNLQILYLNCTTEDFAFPPTLRVLRFTCKDPYYERYNVKVPYCMADAAVIKMENFVINTERFGTAGNFLKLDCCCNKKRQSFQSIVTFNYYTPFFVQIYHLQSISDWDLHIQCMEKSNDVL